MGPIMSVPPAAVIRAAVSSASSAARYVSHMVGCCSPPIFGPLPATFRPPMVATE